MKTNFHICTICKNAAVLFQDKGGELNCCNQAMRRLAANTEEASTEKHLPYLKRKGNMLIAEIGQTIHPQTPEHNIEYVYVKTKHGGQRIDLTPEMPPIVEFAFVDGNEPIAVYAYCNLHGLWMTEVEKW